MSETLKTKAKWYSSLALADGSLSVARSAGKAARLIQSGTIGGLSKIEREISKKDIDVAERANEGFLSVARTAGKAARLIQSGTIGGLSKANQEISWEDLDVAGRANEGFLSVARSAGKAARLIQSGATSGPSKIEQEISGNLEKSGPTDETPEGNESSVPGVKIESAERFMQPDAMDTKIEQEISREENEEKSEQPDPSNEMKENGASDETPEKSESSAPGVETESDVD